MWHKILQDFNIELDQKVQQLINFFVLFKVFPGRVGEQYEKCVHNPQILPAVHHLLKKSNYEVLLYY